MKGSLILHISHSRKTIHVTEHARATRNMGKASCAVHQFITLCLRSLQCLCSERTWDKARFWERKGSSTICTNASDYHYLSKPVNSDLLLFFQDSGDDFAICHRFFSLKTVCCLFCCLFVCTDNFVISSRGSFFFFFFLRN